MIDWPTCALVLGLCSLAVILLRSSPAYVRAVRRPIVTPTPAALPEPDVPETADAADQSAVELAALRFLRPRGRGDQ